MSDSREMVRSVAADLVSLSTKFVFTGGAVVPFYLDVVRPADVRSTLDVDVVVEAQSRRAFYGIEASLRGIGWVNSMSEDAPICRWYTPSGVLVDVMPSSEEVLGFSNRWYAEGLANTLKMAIAEAQTISVFAAPYFIATKIEAFVSRGRKDWFASHDLEDILSMIEGRPALVKEIERSDIGVRSEIAQWANELLALSSFADIVEAHTSPEAARSGQVSVVLDRLRQIASVDG